MYQMDDGHEEDDKYTSTKAYRWSTQEDILIRVKCSVSKSALDAVETSVASECIVSPCRKTGDWLQALENDKREDRIMVICHTYRHTCIRTNTHTVKWGA